MTAASDNHNPVVTPAQVAANMGEGGDVAAAPAPLSADKLALEAAQAFGRIDEQGRVFVKEASGEREVGQYPAELPENPLDLYVRRFLDLQAQVDLAHARFPQLSAQDIDSTIKSLESSLEAPAAVGDLDGLRARVAKLKEDAVARKAEIAKEREAAKAKALEERTKIVTTAEKIAAQDPERTQWKQSGQRLRDLLEEWKNLQRRGPRIDRQAEDALWKRFSSARTTFDRHRKQFFSQLDASQAKAKALKEELIARAEQLSTSTDWSGTAAAFRSLMAQWKEAGRAAHKDDDALWTRFRAAQQIFFDAREKSLEQASAEEAENLKVKEELAAQAEALLPITDVGAAKAALRPILDAWDQAGRVPRADVQRMEKRIRAVEQAIAQAQEEQWRRSNPETKARAQGLMGQLEGLIEELEAKLAKAQAAGDAKATQQIEEDLAARRAWLEQARRTAGEEA